MQSGTLGRQLSDKFETNRERRWTKSLYGALPRECYNCESFPVVSVIGIDFHGDRFVRYCAARQPLRSVATLGRLHLFLPELILKFGRCCEPMLLSLGADSVESYDVSGF